jgi:two-component system sensor histidine kinase YesM
MPLIKMNTLSSRLLGLFIAVTLLLLLILVLFGNYAKDLGLSQVANSYRNLVDSNKLMIDKSLGDIASNLVYTVSNHP